MLKMVESRLKLLVFLLLFPVFCLLSPLFLSGCCIPERHEWPERTELSIAAYSEPATLDPALAVDIASGILASRVHAGLVRFADDRLTIIPDLADSWNVSAEGRIWTFILKERLEFADGSPLLAGDVLRSFRRLLNPETRSQRNWILADVQGAKEFCAGETTEVSGLRTVGDLTVEIHLAQSSPAFLSLLAMPNAVVVKQEKEKFIGAGIWQIAEFNRGRGLALDRNPRYWMGSDVVERLNVRLFQDSSAAYAEFQAGRLDIFPIPAERVPRYLESADFGSRFVIHRQPKLNIWYVALNCSKPPFADPRIRQALNYAVNREQIVQSLLAGCADPARGPVPPTLRQWMLEKTYTNDLTKAVRLLKEAGFGPEKPLEFAIHYRASDEIGEIVMAMFAPLSAIGINATPSPMEWNGLKARINQGEVNAAYVNWTADYPDAHNFLYPLFYGANAGTGGNRSFYQDPVFDTLMDQAVAESNDEKRALLYAALEEKVVEDAPWIFLWHEIEHVAVAKNVEGYRLPEIYSQDRLLGVSKVKK